MEQPLLEKLYKLFMTVDYETFMNILDGENYTSSYLKSFMKKMAIEKGELEEFNRKNIMKYKYARYIYQVIHETDYDRDVIIEYIKNTPKFDQFLEEYFKVFPEDRNKIYLFEQFKIKKEVKERIYDVTRNEGTNYYFLINNLLNSSRNDAISILRKRHIMRDEFDYLINLYKKYHAKEAKENLNLLNSIFEEYVTSFGIEKEEKELDLSFYINKINDFINSGLSFNEYCSREKISFKELKNIASMIRVKFPNLYKQFEDRCISNESFDEIITDVINNILNNDDFDIIDYYSKTGLSFENFLMLTKEMNLPKEDLIKVKIKIKKLKSYANNCNLITKDKIMEGKFIINGVEINKEEKQLIINYLEKNNIPLKFYSFAFKKYIKNKELFKMSEEEEFFVNLKNLSNFELYDYVVSIFEKYKYANISQFWTYYNNHANVEQKELIKIKREEFRKCNHPDMLTINKLLKNNLNGFISYFPDKRKTEIIKLFKKYNEYFGDETGIITDFINNPDKYFNKNVPNLVEVLNNMANRTGTAKYIIDLNEVLGSTKENALTFFRKNHYKKENVDSLIKKFRILFPNNDEYKLIESYFNEYEKSYSSIKLEVVNLKEFRDKLLDEVYDSGLSLIEFCSINGKSVTNYTEILKIYRTNAKALEIKARSTENIDKKFKELCYTISTNDDFDMLDYYSETKLRVVEFLRYVKKLYPNSVEYYKFSTKLSGLRKTLIPKMTREQALDSRFVVGNIELNEEDINMIYDYLDEYNYPYQTFMVVAKKLVEEKKCALKVLK